MQCEFLPFPWEKIHHINHFLIKPKNSNQRNTPKKGKTRSFLSDSQWQLTDRVILNEDFHWKKLLIFIDPLSSVLNSMAVQWLGFQTLTAEGLGSIPSQETKILLALPCDKSRHHIEKQRHHFIDNGQSYVFFPIVMYEFKSWTIKKVECQRIDAFELWCWRRLLRVPWTAKRSNQSILKKSTLNFHWKDWCWSWSSNALATWCKEPTHWKRPRWWERLKATGEEGGRRWDG